MASHLPEQCSITELSPSPEEVMFGIKNLRISWTAEGMNYFIVSAVKCHARQVQLSLHPDTLCGSCRIEGCSRQAITPNAVCQTVSLLPVSNSTCQKTMGEDL